ncbi:cupin domain-containing protein [Streptomyces sp. NPDC050535]|uniref:cupin domain-containing protein n=1 Tax=Streptomyces sp. NPDC050535 TaxID=3365626 RepID=UPI00379E9E29
MTFVLPRVPDQEDPRWTRRDGIFVRRDEGVTKWMTGDTTTVKISSAQTSGALGVLETSVPPGGGALPHAHGREEEAFYVLSGDFDFVNGDEIIQAGPGDLLFVPRGNRHGFTNTGALPAKLLTFIMPGGHEGFWLDNGTDPQPGKSAPPLGPEGFAALAQELVRHQVTVMPDSES